MRISIWQQFSSNHSASFDIVGSFKSAEDAQAATDKLNQIMETISAWWRDNKSDEWVEKIHADQLTPPEQELQATYDVDWPRSVVGDYAMLDRELQIRAVKQHVFVESDVGYLCPSPFDQLMQRIGGQVAVKFSEGLGKPVLGRETWLTANLTFTAADESTAQQFEKTWRQFLSGSNDPKIPPWLVYHNRKVDPQAEALVTTAKLYYSQTLDDCIISLIGLNRI